MHLRLVIAATLSIVALCADTPAGAQRPPVVLGKNHLLDGGRGWGRAHPASVDNGGDPSGDAFALRWAGWGDPSAYAHGLNWIFRPDGGYYREPGEIELRAYRLGQCVAGGPRAYTRLEARVVSRPGGPLGAWFAWGGWTTLCRWPSFARH